MRVVNFGPKAYKTGMARPVGTKSGVCGWLCLEVASVCLERVAVDWRAAKCFQRVEIFPLNVMAHFESGIDNAFKWRQCTSDGGLVHAL